MIYNATNDSTFDTFLPGLPRFARRGEVTASPFIGPGTFSNRVQYAGKPTAINAETTKPVRGRENCYKIAEAHPVRGPLDSRVKCQHHTDTQRGCRQFPKYPASYDCTPITRSSSPARHTRVRRRRWTEPALQMETWLDRSSAPCRLSQNVRFLEVVLPAVSLKVAGST